MERKFEVTIMRDESDCGTVVLELDQKVIDVVDDEWRAELYDLRTPEQIAEHIAYNMVVHEARLTDLDGWADLSDDMAKIVEYKLVQPSYSFLVKEIVPCKKCGQVDVGQTGEYQCPACGLPTVHDGEPE